MAIFSSPLSIGWERLAISGHDLPLNTQKIEVFGRPPSDGE